MNGNFTFVSQKHFDFNRFYDIFTTFIYFNSHVLSLVCQHTVKATTFVMNEWFLQCCFSYGHSQLLWIFARSLAL